VQRHGKTLAVDLPDAPTSTDSHFISSWNYPFSLVSIIKSQVNTRISKNKSISEKSDCHLGTKSKIRCR
jgi:hypothetical protein